MSETPIPPEAGENQSCSTSCWCGKNRWGIWLILVLLLGVYIAVSQREVSHAPSAIAWIENYEAGIAQAKQKERLVFLDFYATWCGPCRLMDEKVYSDPKVAQALADWVAIKIDVDRNATATRRYHIQAMPTLIALSPGGQILARFEGALSTDQLIQFIQFAEKKASQPAD